MRSGLIISGLLHAVLLFLMLTQPLTFSRDRSQRPQPLVEFTYFDAVKAIEAEIEESLDEDEAPSVELEEPPPDSLTEAEPDSELAEETAPEAVAEEVAQEDSPEEIEPEALSEAESELEAREEAIEEVAEEIAQELAEESALPELAEAEAPLELPELPGEPQALADTLAEEPLPTEIDVAETAPAIAAGVTDTAPEETPAVETALPETSPVLPALAESAAPTAEAPPQTPAASTSEPLLAAIPEETPAPLLAEEPEEPLQLAAPALAQPEQLPPRRPESLAERPDTTQADDLAALPPLASDAAPGDLTAQYQPQWSGRVRGDQLLDNLALVRDEDAQARANPALWEVVRLLRQQVKECWQLGRSGLANPDYFVEMEVRLQRSGVLAHAHILDVAKMVDDESFAAFARNARTALERCAPYDLPADRYALWGDLVVRFLARGQGLAGR